MDFIKNVFKEFSNDRCSTWAASLAYYTAFALPPLLYLLLTVLTAVLSIAYEGDAASEKAQNVIVDQAAQMLGNASASEEIASILENHQATSGFGWKTAISFVGILLGATGVVVALQDSLNRVWGVMADPESSSVRQVIGKRILSLGMILGLGFVMLVSLTATTVLSVAGEKVGGVIGLEKAAAAAVNHGVQALVIYVVFAAIFRFMPDADVRWRDVLIGALVTTILFLLGQFGMQWYFAYAEPGAAFGAAAASFAVILVWVYYSSLILLLGAEVTQVYASRYGHGIRPEPNAVYVVEEIRRPGDGNATDPHQSKT